MKKALKADALVFARLDVFIAARAGQNSRDGRFVDEAAEVGDGFRLRLLHFLLFCQFFLCHSSNERLAGALCTHSKTRYRTFCALQNRIADAIIIRLN